MLGDGMGEGGTDAFLEFAGRQQPGRFEDAPLAMDPFRFDRIVPRALDRQEAGDDADAAVTVSPLVVRAANAGSPR